MLQGMMGIPISGPSYNYGDKMFIVYNTSRPKSILGKKSNYVCYHTVYESVEMGKSQVGHIPSKEKLKV